MIPGDAASSTFGFCAERAYQFRGIDIVHLLGGPSDVSLGHVHRTVGRYRWWSVVVLGGFSARTSVNILGGQISEFSADQVQSISKTQEVRDPSNLLTSTEESRRLNSLCNHLCRGQVGRRWSDVVPGRLLHLSPKVRQGCQHPRVCHRSVIVG